jgi:hypothetical protein
MKIIIKNLETGRVHTNIFFARNEYCSCRPYCTGCGLLEHFGEGHGNGTAFGCYAWTVLNPVEAAKKMGYRVLHFEDDGKVPVIDIPF